MHFSLSYFVPGVVSHTQDKNIIYYNINPLLPSAGECAVLTVLILSPSALPLAGGLGVEDAIPHFGTNQHRPAMKINEDL